MKIHEKREIGEYKGLKLFVYYDTFDSIHKFRLDGKVGRSGDLGKDNIVRLDNVISSIPETIDRLENQLISLNSELEKSKFELSKPFEKSNELQSKIQRLVEVENLINSKENNNNKEYEVCL